MVDVATGTRRLHRRRRLERGATDTTSGDRAWWFDFNSLTRPGTYRVVDGAGNVRSSTFGSEANVYRPVLVNPCAPSSTNAPAERPRSMRVKAGPTPPATSARCKTPAPAADALPRTTPAPARPAAVGTTPVTSTKYTSWTAGCVVDLLHAYSQNKPIWTDDFNIPESGNGLPTCWTK